MVATIAIGRRPAARSATIEAARAPGNSSNRSLTGIRTSEAATQPERHARLLDRRMRLARGVHAQPGAEIVAPGQAPRRGIGAGRLAGRGQGDERRGRCRVGQEAIEGGRQAERLAQPVDHDLLEFRADRRGPPEHRVLTEHRGQHLTEDPWARCGRREICKEARVLPVRGVGFDEGLVVREDRVDRFGRLGGGRREQRAERAGFDRREDGAALDAFEVVGHHVDHGMRGGPEGSRVHVERRTAGIVGDHRQTDLPISMRMSWI